MRWRCSRRWSLLPGFLALGGELLLDALELPAALDGLAARPVYLLISVDRMRPGALALLACAWTAKGQWLQRQEQAILETVTQRAE